MIEISRALARQFRAVLRRGALDPGSRGAWPPLLCRAGQEGLTLEAGQGDVAVRYHRPGERPPGVVAFRASVLAEFEGKADAPVVLEAAPPDRGRARWSEGGVPQVAEFPTVAPETVPELPEVPARLAGVPESFLVALGEASRAAAREATRFAVTRVQLRGETGQVVATDGRQMLVQGGFQLPWRDSILVPRLPLLDLPGVCLDQPAGLARTEQCVILRVGDWTFWLKIDAGARFPAVDDAIPRGNATSRLRLDPEDAAFLIATLPKLPGRDDDHSPITIDLGTPPAVRARAAGGGPATEVVLARSEATGPAVRVATDRHYLLRAAQLGFAVIQVLRPDVPLVCREADRTYVWMPLDQNAAVPPGQDVQRLVSAEGVAPPPTEPPTERRRTVMPPPSGNGRPPEDRPPSGAPERNGGIGDLIGEAEALRNLLAEASARSARLVAALKQHRRQARAVEAAVVSLRQLNLGG